MSIKNEKGVTITILVITIIVMLILFGITFTTATDLLKNSQRNRTKTMLYMVRSRAQILLDDFMFDNSNGNGSVDITTLKNGNTDALAGKSSTDSELSTVGYSNGNDYIYKTWDEQTLLNQGIDTKNLSEGDTIIVQYDLSKEEVDVASTKGFSEDGVGIHTLKEFSE